MPKAIHERGPVDTETFAREIATAYVPIVLRGQVADWPAVHAGAEGPAAMARYINGLSRGQPVEVMVGAPEIAGRFFYSDDMRGFNFRRSQVPLPNLLQELLRLGDIEDPPAVYAGAAATNDCLPGWQQANPPPLPTPGANPRIWIGNATRVALHYDVSDNIACVVAGRRRFTLIPPEQIANLYVGPLEWTLAGQPTSMVDHATPDFDRYPRFAEALANSASADLEPGDAIYIPSLWWHGVDAQASFNVLLNYWWGQADDTPAFAAMIHTLLSIRDVSPGERRAWRAWFDHYVFDEGAAEATVAHLPPHAHGVLDAPSPGRTRKIKEYLKRALDRR